MQYVENIFSHKYCCPCCTRPVRTGSNALDAVGCDGHCKQWYHRECISLSAAEFQEIIINEAEWKCPECIASNNAIEARITREATPVIETAAEVNIRRDVYPEYRPANNQGNTSAGLLSWGCLKGYEEINHALSYAYAEIVTWEKNFFKIPYGRIGKSLVEEASKLIASYNEDPNWEGIAIKAVMVLLPLALQKPSKTSKTKDHKMHLERRIGMWRQGSICSLVSEGKAIQKRISSSRSRKQQNLSKSFCNLVLQGKLRAASKLLNEMNSAPLEINNEVLSILKQKHPPGKMGGRAVIENPTPNVVEPITFEGIDSNLIYRAALNTRGSGGPTKIDSDTWRQMLCSKSFLPASENLCEQVSILTRRLCRGYVDPKPLAEFTAGRLIALDKDPESTALTVRPLGIGEVLRRIVGKTVMAHLKPEISTSAGPLQTCAGTPGGIEAAIHAMNDIAEDNETEAILLVDAANAFNCLNREAALLNMNLICPEFQKYLVNTYRDPPRLYLNGCNGEFIESEEGSTQGDNAAMSMYSCSTRPLIDHLRMEGLYTAKSVTKPKQIWYADDSGAAGKLKSLRIWWDELSKMGPVLGYFPEPSKCHLVVKNQEIYNQAAQIFHGTDIKFNMEGRKYLGSAVGTREFVSNFVRGKVAEWCAEVKSLAEIAISEPHTAYYAFTKAVSMKWQFLMRTTRDIADLFEPLERAIRKHFIPALVGRKVTDLERDIFSLPPRLGGLGIFKPNEMAQIEFDASSNITKQLANLIKKQATNFEEINKEEVKREKANSSRLKKQFQNDKLLAIIANPAATTTTKRAIEMANEKGSSLWLTTQPSIEHAFFFNKVEFKDALCLRYGWEVKGLPKHCACGAENDTDHCLICKKGGYVGMRHNALRDTEAAIMKEVCYDVKVEPSLIPVENEELPRGTNKLERARLDISARSVWSQLDRVFFDIRVTHPNTRTNASKSPAQIYKEQEREKKGFYNRRVIEVEKGTFTPLVFTTSGGMAPECERLNKRLAELIAAKRKEKYADVIAYIRKRLRFALLKATLVALRGYRGPQRKTEAIELSEVAFNFPS